jgi:chaperonin GroEL (HSP60 family)
LEHHDQYDSKTSQSKGLTPDELRIYRSALEDAVRAAFNSALDPRDLPASPPPAAAYRVVDDSLFIPVGHASPYFATDGEVTCDLAEPRVLIVGTTLSAMRDVLPIFEQASRATTPLLVVADSFGEEVLATMIVNTQRRVLLGCAIALAEPSRGETRRAIARFSAATVFSDEAGRALENATLEDLGRLVSVRADLKSTILKGAVR